MVRRRRSIVLASRLSGGFYGLWRVRTSGGAPVRLTGTDIDARQPAVSRRGDRLAYVSVSADMNIWRAAVDGKTAAQPLIASTRADTDPQYSPDGKQIAFRSDRAGNSAIWVTDSEGAAPVRVADLNGPPLGPTAALVAGRTYAGFRFAARIAIRDLRGASGSQGRAA
jgi:hypothetical protein